MTTTKVPQAPEERALSNVIDFAAYRERRDKRRQATEPVDHLARAAELSKRVWARLAAAGLGTPPDVSDERPARVEHHIRRFLSEGDFVWSEIAAAEERERARASKPEHRKGSNGRKKTVR